MAYDSDNASYEVHFVFWIDDICFLHSETSKRIIYKLFRGFTKNCFRDEKYPYVAFS